MSFTSDGDTSRGAAGVAEVLPRQSRAPGDDVSPRAAQTVAHAGASDVSPGDGRDGAERRALCLWCRVDLPATSRTIRYCSKKCRQTAWRARRIAVVEGLDDTPKRLGYGDPPYPGLARKYYGDQPNYAGEVDHAELVSRLQGFDGWALSTSARALRVVLPLCPPEARVCAWIKPIGACPKTRGPHNTWEPVIVKPARRRQPGARDYLVAQPARGGGALPGRKPIKFCMWLFELLGAAPGDTLADLFPGTGIVSRCFEQFRAEHAGCG